ncbi:hypothetical protein Nepgr_006632 [Nepenthes gracilis]|uniref:Uncharacterized protein n=1 Tax=Nepenthes gracilis TaxID=150966 RepID=A0AAD3S5D9_NEPGR|nr:hypothetical protein Nepgr_006632 [Nepenthes gracilis]
MLPPEKLVVIGPVGCDYWPEPHFRSFASSSISYFLGFHCWIASESSLCNHLGHSFSQCQLAKQPRSSGNSWPVQKPPSSWGVPSKAPSPLRNLPNLLVPSGKEGLGAFPIREVSDPACLDGSSAGDNSNVSLLSSMHNADQRRSPCIDNSNIHIVHCCNRSPKMASGKVKHPLGDHQLEPPASHPPLSGCPPPSSAAISQQEVSMTSIEECLSNISSEAGDASLAGLEGMLGCLEATALTGLVDGLRREGNMMISAEDEGPPIRAVSRLEIPKTSVDPIILDSPLQTDVPEHELGSTSEESCIKAPVCREVLDPVLKPQNLVSNMNVVGFAPEVLSAVAHCWQMAPCSDNSHPVVNCSSKLSPVAAEVVPMDGGPMLAPCHSGFVRVE